MAHAHHPSTQGLKLENVTSLRPLWATKGDHLKGGGNKGQGQSDLDQMERAGKQGPRGSSRQQRAATKKHESDHVLGPYWARQALTRGKASGTCSPLLTL